MKRKILSKLIEWKNKKNRKPLIVNGARQVGKTYILKEFGSHYYEKMAYVNCDKNKTLDKYFLRTITSAEYCSLFQPFCM